MDQIKITGFAKLEGKVEVSSAEIKTSNTSPKELISAPGTDKFIEIISCVVRTFYIAPLYSGADNLRINYGTSGAVDLNTFVPDMNTGAFDKMTTLDCSLSATFAPISLINQGVYLFSNTSDPTTGNGTLEVYITYRLIDMS